VRKRTFIACDSEGGVLEMVSVTVAYTPPPRDPAEPDGLQRRFPPAGEQADAFLTELDTLRSVKGVTKLMTMPRRYEIVVKTTDQRRAILRVLAAAERAWKRGPRS
jgi:hypothetical protein